MALSYEQKGHARQTTAGLLILAIFSGVTHAQTISERPLLDLVIIPQARELLTLTPDSRVEISGVEATIKISGQVAETNLDVTLVNHGGTPREAEMIVPVPEGSVVRSFSYSGAPKDPAARLLPREEARRIYDSIVARMRDPALLEFVGTNLIRSSVFPIEAGGTQKVSLTYEMLLPSDGNRVDYVLLRTESLDYRIPWKIKVTISSSDPISTVYSPTHNITSTRDGDTKVQLHLTESAERTPGPFRLPWLMNKADINASLIAYPDPAAGGGYCLLLMGLPMRTEKASAPAIKREIQIVFDRSGSMNGEKIEQVREAALQVIGALEPGEKFNILTYNDTVDAFAETPVPNTTENIDRAREYLKTVRAIGGTNIHDALLEALRQKPGADTLPIILFLTDGLATVGQTSEASIRDMVMKANIHRRRVFCFGAGVDVNAPLLDKIAESSRAVSTYVMPGENVEVKVEGVFRRLSGPVMAEPDLKLITKDGKDDPGRVRDLLPARLPDLFDGDQLVLLGQYLGDSPLTFELTGNYLGGKRSFIFDFPLSNASTRNAYVPRLWASRKIAMLIDAIRQMGAEGDPYDHRPPDHNDPRIRELVDEIVRLSTEYGILTEYTAFLASEETELTSPNFRAQSLAPAGGNLAKRAIGAREGFAGIAQSMNNSAMKSQNQLNYENAYLNDDMDQVRTHNVQQVNDLAFYQRGECWIDSRLAGKKDIKPSRTVKIGTPEYQALVTRLATENRQGCLSLKGDILLDIDDAAVLIEGAE